MNSGSVVYAHPLIRKVMTQVMTLENQWVDIKQANIDDENIKPIVEVISKLSGTNVAAAISNSVFQYLCAARIFAKYIYKMFVTVWKRVL